LSKHKRAVPLLGCVAALIIGTMTLSSCAVPQPHPIEEYHGFPLRATFGLGRQLSPTPESRAAAFCTLTGRGPTTDDPYRYLCRHAYGYEEGGAAVTYYLTDDGVMTIARRNTWGATLVTYAGGRYEGCAFVGFRQGHYVHTWICDYRTSWHTAMIVDQPPDLWAYLRLLRSWGQYTFDAQVSCAAGIGSWWAGKLAGLVATSQLWEACLKAPFTSDGPHSGTVASEPTSTDELPIDAGGTAPLPDGDNVQVDTTNVEAPMPTLNRSPMLTQAEAEAQGLPDDEAPDTSTVGGAALVQVRDADGNWVDQP
jgi:hypothetical protein